MIHCTVRFISRVKIWEASSHERESCWPVRTFRYSVMEAARQAVSERKLDDQQSSRQKAAMIVDT